MSSTAPSTLPDLFQKSPNENPLEIIIAGAGIGGLFAAIALSTNGHKVTIYESSRFALETGAAIHLAPNITSVLTQYNIHPETFGAVNCEWLTQMKPDGSVVFKSDLRPLAKVYPTRWQLVHRIDLHNALKERAEALGAVIKLHSRVKGVDCEKGELVLESGETVSGDLVLGGDGVHSVLRNAVLGYETSPKPSGTSCFRFLLPTSAIKSDPLTAPFADTPGEMTMVFGEERRLVSYPCRNNTEMNFVAMIPDYESGASDGADWNQSGSKETLLRLYSNHSEPIRALLEKAPEETVKLWKLLDHEALPNWTRGKVALLGDAAHPFLPHQGQGGAQAMEDGAALGALLPAGITAADLPQRLELYVKARYERATLIQNYTRDSGFQAKGVEHVKKEIMDPMTFSNYNFRHNAYEHAGKVLRGEV